MVRLKVKKGDEDLFLFDTPATTPVNDVIAQLVPIYNGRLKVHRICSEMESLADHGICLPPEMQGLTDEQIVELKLTDSCGEKCLPSGGYNLNEDKFGRRNGKAPLDSMKDVLLKTVKEAKEMISKKLVEKDVLLSIETIKESMEILRGAVTIVYPMGLPSYDPIRLEFEQKEDLSGTQASLDVLDVDQTSLWFAGKEMVGGKLIADFVGRNEKTKVVVKLQKKGQGAPAREAVINEQTQRELMLYQYRKQEEFKKLEEDDDDSYMNSAWADQGSLKKQFQGLNNIKWR